MARGKVVLITGVEHFVGPGAVPRLLADGALVVAQDASFADAALRADYAARHPGATPIAGDEPRAIIAAALAVHGRIDAVVSNDDFPAIRAPIAEASLDDLRAGLEAMLVRPFALAQAAVPVLRGQGGGRILLVTSAAPLRGLSNYSMYTAGRGAANALISSLAKELAPDNILVNAVAPNYVANPSYFPPELIANAAAMAKITKNIPLGRLGQPEEVGALVAFLAAGDCGFMTGHILPIAGGWA